MFFVRQTGIGQDHDLISLRRRNRLGVLFFVVGGLLALVLSLSLLRDRRGTLLVNADQPGAYVILNGTITDRPAGKPIKRLPPDVYSVSVHLAGHQSQPPARVVKIKAGKTAEVSFQLVLAPPEPEVSEVQAKRHKTEITEQSPSNDRPKTAAVSPRMSKDAQNFEEQNGSKGRSPAEQASQPGQSDQPQGTLEITTSPVAGSIFVDDVFQGIGTITLTDLTWGETIVRFGEVEGYRAPAPQKAFLSPARPSADLEAIYLPLIYIAASLGPSGRTMMHKCRIQQGYILGESGPQPDHIIGPGIKFLDDIKTFAWEIGYALSNRNPPGVDFLEVIFDLPENWDGNKPLELQLCGYASDRKYPFALNGKTAIDVYVNGRIVQKDFQPRLNLEDKSGGDFDVIAVNSFLTPGENRIRIQASPSGRCFYYLKEIVLL